MEVYAFLSWWGGSWLIAYQHFFKAVFFVLLTGLLDGEMTWVTEGMAGEEEEVMCSEVGKLPV